MERILVIGCCGSGKSTLSKKLAAKTGLPVVHLDCLNWRDGWQCVSREEFDVLLDAELAKPAWIIDGNYKRTLPRRLARCDTVLYLDYPRLVCVFGVLRRVVLGHGRTRSDMGGNCPERFDWEFLKYAWNFNKNYRARLYRLLADTDGKTVVFLHNRREAERFLRTL